MAEGRAMDWVLVGLIAVAFIAIPVAIVWRPPALPFRVAYLVLPLGPGVLLAVAAVWYALRRR